MTSKGCEQQQAFHRLENTFWCFCAVYFLNSIWDCFGHFYPNRNIWNENNVTIRSVTPFPGSELMAQMSASIMKEKENNIFIK